MTNPVASLAALLRRIQRTGSDDQGHWCTGCKAFKSMMLESLVHDADCAWATLDEMQMQEAAEGEILAQIRTICLNDGHVHHNAERDFGTIVELLARGRPEGPSAPPPEARRLLVELLEGYDDYVAQTVGGAALIKRIRAYLAVDLGSRPPGDT